MILLAIQTKGGVGKSTISQQVLAPYFLAKDEPATLIEIDDENLDSAYLHDSLVKAEQLPIGSGLTADRAIESLMARVNENLVVDIGGNKTATNFIESAGRMGFFSFVDVVVIPISAPGQDEINALRTAQLIKDVAPETKIVIAVTRQMVRSDSEFSDVFTRYFNADELKLTTGHICYFPQFMGLIHSRQLGKTIFEVAAERDEVLGTLTEEMVAASKAGKKERALNFSRMRASVHESRDILPYIENCHRVIDAAMS